MWTLAVHNSDELIYIWSLYTREMHDFQGYFSRTFQDLKLYFPGLSRSWNFQEKNQGLSRRRGNPEVSK